MVSIWLGLAALVLAAGAELLHFARTRRIARLAFGPTGRPRQWTYAATLLRPLAVGGAVWALWTLMAVEPMVYRSPERAREDIEDHVVFVLDVSPSMGIEDSGPTGEQSRRARAKDVVESFLERGGGTGRKLSVIAFYTDAKPVVEATVDRAVVWNILDDLPLAQAFRPGKTLLFSGIEAAFELCRDWNPDSTNVVIISDGDSVPSSGMPKRPASVAGIVVLGIGNEQRGTFIAGRQSRQDSAALRQVATRLGGVYHNADKTHVATSLVRSLAELGGRLHIPRFGLREYALMTLAVCALLLASLPALLHWFGVCYAVPIPARRVDGSGRVSAAGVSIPPPSDNLQPESKRVRRESGPLSAS